MAIFLQNSRSILLRVLGCPGEIIGDRPVNSFNHPAGRPINTSEIRVSQRPVEFAQFTSAEFQAWCAGNGITQSMGRTGVMEYIEAWYNRQRPNARAGGDTPAAALVGYQIRAQESLAA